MFKNVNDNRYFDIDQPKNIARADCFIVEENDKLYVFFEEFIIEPNRKGYLCVGIIDQESNKIVGIKKILEKEYHLSYPFVFEYEREWYMIPETHSNKTIDLYKFVDFPYHVEKVRTLIDNIDAVDTTVLFREGFVYLFTNVKTNERGHNENLMLFYSNDLLHGIFREYEQNPISTDSRYARMAGNILIEGDQMYRIAQDCSITYGSCMYKFKIDQISPQNYQEHLIGTIKPPKEDIASHTYNKTQNFEIIDVIHKTNFTGMLTNGLALMKIVFNRLKNG